MKRLSKKSVRQADENHHYRRDAYVGYFEKRGETRIAYRSRVRIKELKSGVFVNAKMKHYSKRGVYIEANRLVLPGTVIYLGIEDSPFIPYANVYDVYRAEIVWLRRLNSKSYKYGHGVNLKLINSNA